jgi:ABC-type antimicrobial peptide transport system permease subunit
MRESKDILPPVWATRLLSWYCKPELLEDLQGDLNEYFERNVKSKGSRRARLIYIIDVLKFLRLYTLRKPEFFNLFIQWIMIGSYIKTSGRSLVRNKLFSTINIVGLAISMSVGLLLIGLLSDLFSYDQFHEKRDRIYRVISGYEYLGKADNTFYGSTSLRTGKAIQESIPGVEEIAILRRGFGGDVKTINKTVPLEGLWANESFFDIFTFPMLAGDPSTALKNPFSIVLTEKSAKKLFGETDPIGKTIIPFKDKEFVVTGVIKDVPLFSHMKFDMLGSISTREITEKENKQEMQWDNMWMGYVYLLLPANADLKTLQANLTKLASKEDETVKNTKIKLSLQALPDIALGEDLNNSIGPVMDGKTVWIVGVLSLIVILSACFNYTNLSIARSLRRSREVGIRKVIGALNSHVLGQFMVEAVIISLLALALSFVLFILLRPSFLSINPKLQDMALLNLSPKVVVYFILLAVGVGMAAGLFPALFFARINAVQVLKDVSTLRMFRNVNMRKALIVAQYTISLMFIATTTIGYKQYKHYLSFDLGFNTENILNIQLQGNKADLLLKDLNEMPEVKGLSKSTMVTSVGSYYGTLMKYINPQDSIGVYFNKIDENYLPLHGHKLLAGRNFAAKAGKVEETEVIVSEDALKYFNIAGNDPVKALGEMVTIDGKKMEIIAVMKNFHYGKADNNNQDTNRAMRVVFRYSNDDAEYVNVKIISTDWAATLATIDKVWRKIDDVHPLDAKFYDEEIERSYGEYSALIKILGFLAFLAICISSMGLLGMVVFTTETRLKEISIRKVLGASELRLIYLLSKGFLFLLAIAAIIAIPATYLFFDKIVLVDFANSVPINITELLSGVLIVMAIAFILLGSQTLKVARTNPAEVLKNE